MSEKIAIEGIWLRYVGGENNPHARVTVEVEIEGEWIEVIRETHASAFSHSVTPRGILEESLRQRGSCVNCEHPYGSKKTLFRLQKRGDSVLCPGCKGIFPAWAFMPDDWHKEWEQVHEGKMPDRT